MIPGIIAGGLRGLSPWPNFVGQTSLTFTGDGSTPLNVDLTSLTGGIASEPSEGDIVLYFYGRVQGGGAPGTTTPQSNFCLLYNDSQAEVYGSRLLVGAARVPSGGLTSITGASVTSSNFVTIAAQVWRDVLAIDGNSFAKSADYGRPNPPAVATAAGRIILGCGVAGGTSSIANLTSSDLSDFLSLRQGGSTVSCLGLGRALASGSSFDPAEFGGGSTDGNSSWHAGTLSLAMDDGLASPTSGNVQTSSSTTASTSAFATKGSIMWSLGVGEIDSLDFYIAPSGTETYKAVVARLNPDNTIAAIIGSSSPQNISSTGVHSFALTTPAQFGLLHKYAFMLVRTDGTTTSIARIPLPTAAGASNAQWKFFGSVRYASTDPQVSDNVLFGTDSVGRVNVHYDYLA